jgi:hypothetical protein
MNKGDIKATIGTLIIISFGTFCAFQAEKYNPNKDGSHYLLGGVLSIAILVLVASIWNFLKLFFED